MPSLFDIGKSGLQAYRQSLAVTGQNIANINTDGYKKRAASLEEVSGAGGGVTEISDQTGLGVRVNEIRRAFDEFLIDKVRQTSSLFEKSDTYLDEVKDLENLLLPSDSNLSKSIGEFFHNIFMFTSNTLFLGTEHAKQKLNKDFLRESEIIVSYE